MKPINELSLNIKEFSFLTKLPPVIASDILRQVAEKTSGVYKKGQRVNIQDLQKGLNFLQKGKKLGDYKLDLLKEATHIRQYYLKYQENRHKILNDTKSIKNQRLGRKYSFLKTFLDPADVDTIRHNWEVKRKTQLCQTSLFEHINI